MADAERLRRFASNGVGVRVPLVAPSYITNSILLIMKQPKARNSFVPAMKGRKGGKMKSKKVKRKNGKNKQKAYLSEDY